MTANADATARYVVKRRRTIDGVEVSSVLTPPIPADLAILQLQSFNAEYQDPGNYYIDKWQETT